MTTRTLDGSIAALRPIADIAAEIGLDSSQYATYGGFAAKIDPRIAAGNRSSHQAAYVVVTSISPTPVGEGKTTISIGLAQGLRAIGKRAIVALRQGSLGPSFGIKGGGAGGGRSTLEPAELLNLHLTGDMHAVTAAHNACSAFLDNLLHQGNTLGIEPDSISWPRVLDMNDRALRSVTTGQGEKNGPSRQSGFEITAASEVMSVLSLAASYADLRERLGNIVVGFSYNAQPVTANEIRVAGAMAALLRDALSPNLVQTQEGTPAFVHTGPFGNVGLGNSSVIADQIALKLAEVVITESGFGSDLGFEKFCNVKCRASGLAPDAAVMVVTARSLKAHSGQFNVRPGRPLDPGLDEEHLSALEAGLPNLAKHLENVRWYGIPVVVAINSYPTDTEREVQMIRDFSLAAGALDAVVTTGFRDGGTGSKALARSVLAAIDEPSNFRFLYDTDQSLQAKIFEIATRMYGACDVEYDSEAKDAIDRFEAAGSGHLPICMAKTQYSLSDDPKLLSRPDNFSIRIRAARLYAGAGYIVPIVGNIMLMHGLGKHPSGENIDLLPDGTIIGLS